MAKSSALGSDFLADGYQLGGDIGSLSGLGWTRNLLEVTPITKSAPEKIPGLVDASLGFQSFFNDATGQSHLVLRNPPTTDSHMLWTKGSAIGDVAAALAGKRSTYTPQRGTDGGITIGTQAQGNGVSFDFGNLLTAGLRTDVAATDGTSLDGLAATTSGWSAYLHVIDVTGTNVVVTLEDSANNIAFATFTGSAFASQTADNSFVRIAGAAGATVRRYVRAVSSGTFDSATFIVMFCRTPAAL